MRKKVDSIEDRLITPYLIYTYLPTQTKYADFPLVYDNDYQKTRYYSDERPLTLESFNKMRKEERK